MDFPKKIGFFTASTAAVAAILVGAKYLFIDQVQANRWIALPLIVLMYCVAAFPLARRSKEEWKKRVTAAGAVGLVLAANVALTPWSYEMGRIATAVPVPDSGALVVVETGGSPIGPFHASRPHAIVHYEYPPESNATGLFSSEEGLLAQDGWRLTRVQPPGQTPWGAPTPYGTIEAERDGMRLAIAIGRTLPGERGEGSIRDGPVKVLVRVVADPG